MKILILLLFSITAFSIVGARITLPLKALKFDLSAIQRYYHKGDTYLDAYIYWPKSATFRVRPSFEQDRFNGFLKIDGDFRIVKLDILGSQLTQKIEGLYYKDNFFYNVASKVRNEDGKGETMQLKWLPSSTKVSYVEPVIQEKKSFVSIRYFSLEEIEAGAEAIYNANKDHFNTVLDLNRATFMATVSGSNGQFVEYTYPSDYFDMPIGEDAKIWVLSGSGKGSSMKIRDFFIAYQLLYHPKKRTFFVSKSFDLFAGYEKNVIGVRMANTAYLAEVRGSQRQLFSDADLDFDLPLPRNLEISKRDLLEKSSQVEPRMIYQGIKPNYSPKIWPTDIKFQVKGITFTKSFSNIATASCPFLISRENTGIISFDGRSGTVVCSNDRDMKVIL